MSDCNHYVGIGRQHSDLRGLATVNMYAYEKWLEDLEEGKTGYTMLEYFKFCPKCGKELDYETR